MDTTGWQEAYEIIEYIFWGIIILAILFAMMDLTTVPDKKDKGKPKPDESNQSRQN